MIWKLRKERNVHWKETAKQNHEYHPYGKSKCQENGPYVQRDWMYLKGPKNVFRTWLHVAKYT